MKPFGFAVTLVAAGPDERVPQGVPLTRARMRSLDTPTVRVWLEDHRRDAIFAVAGHSHPAGRPSLVIGVAPDEYERLATTSV